LEPASRPQSAATQLGVGLLTYALILVFSALFGGRIGIFVLFPLLTTISILVLVFILLTPLRERVPVSVVVAIAVGWPCALLMSLMGLGDLGPAMSVRPVEGLAPLDAESDFLMDGRDLTVHPALQGGALQESVYTEQPTKTQKKATFYFYVAPLTPTEWGPGDMVPYWAACSDLEKSLGDCLSSWESSPEALLRAAPDLVSDFRRAAQDAVSQHGLDAAENAPIFYVMSEDEVRELGRLPLRLLAVALTGLLIWGAVTWRRSRFR